MKAVRMGPVRLPKWQGLHGSLLLLCGIHFFFGGGGWRVWSCSFFFFGLLKVEVKEVATMPSEVMISFPNGNSWFLAQKN